MRRADEQWQADFSGRGAGCPRHGRTADDNVEVLAERTPFEFGFPEGPEKFQRAEKVAAMGFTQQLFLAYGDRPAYG